jgi:hypothetical protein
VRFRSSYFLTTYVLPLRVRFFLLVWGSTSRTRRWKPLGAPRDGQAISSSAAADRSCVRRSRENTQHLSRGHRGVGYCSMTWRTLWELLDQVARQSEWNSNLASNQKSRRNLSYRRDECQGIITRCRVGSDYSSRSLRTIVFSMREGAARSNCTISNEPERVCYTKPRRTFFARERHRLTAEARSHVIGPTDPTRASSVTRRRLEFRHPRPAVPSPPPVGVDSRLPRSEVPSFPRDLAVQPDERVPHGCSHH